MFYPARVLLCVTAFISTLTSAETMSLGVLIDHHKYVQASPAYDLSWIVTERASQKAGISLKLEPGIWTRSIKRLQTGKLNGVFAAVHSKQRETWSTFSLPLAITYTQLFTHKHKPVSTYEFVDTGSSVVGIVKDSIGETYARELGFQNLYITSDRHRLYTMLQNNRIDYLIHPQSIIDHYCMYLHPSKSAQCLKTIGTPLGANEVHLMVRKGDNDNIRKIDKINQQIKAMIQSGEILELYIQKGLGKTRYEQWLTSLQLP